MLFLRLGAFKTACEFLAALAGHLGFESLSLRLRTYLYASCYVKDQGACKLRGSMGQVWLVYFLKKSTPGGEHRPERTVQVPPIPTEKIYQILKISLRTAMVLTSLLHSMICRGRGLAHYSLWGPELLWKYLCLLFGWHDWYLISIFLLYSDFSWCHGRTLQWEWVYLAERKPPALRLPRKPCCKNVVGFGHLVGTRSPAVPWQDVNPQETQFGFD